LGAAKFLCCVYDLQLQEGMVFAWKIFPAFSPVGPAEYAALMCLECDDPKVRAEGLDYFSGARAYARYPRRGPPARQLLQYIAPHVIKALGDPSAMTRSKAAGLLRAAGPMDDKFVAQLREMLKANDAAANFTGAAALATLKLADEEVVSVLTKALSARDSSMRQAAINVLEEVGPAAAPAVDGLVRALVGRDASLRTDAARALGAIGPGASAAVPTLSRAVAAGGPLGLCAIRALEQIGPQAVESGMGPIAAALRGDRDSREAAIKALGTVTPAKADVAMRLIAPHTRDRDENVRKAAEEALAKLKILKGG
ncbi:MAG TPA: hypothetical protein VNA25_18695, partial [Phycisphaerae bacterium]|nr:hypothetical protein [Phycisphaerae bacterium]